MNARLLITTIGLVLAFACGCQSLGRKGAQAPAEVTWTIPPDFPTFGTPVADSIRVAIFGYSVIHPGYYHLARGASVHDAMQAAQISDIVGWREPYSGIQRPRPDGSVETIWFKRANQAVDELRVLQNDDRLCISHEVY